MKATTQERIKDAAERIYRIANFAPEDRDQSLTAIDEAGLRETETVIRALLVKQDRDTRHACAEAVNSLASTTLRAHRNDPVMIESIQVAHNACLNAKSI